MRYKGGQASPQLLLSITRALIALYILAPFYAASLLLYHRTQNEWTVTGIEIGIGAVLLVCVALDYVRAHRGQWDRFTPGFTFFEMVIGLALATTINSHVGGDAAVYRIVMILPAFAAAILGDTVMITVMCVLTLVALGAVSWIATHQVDTTVWFVLVWGAALVGTVMATHLIVARLLSRMRVADALHELAIRGGRDPRWPDDLVSGLAWVAGALEAREVAALVTRGDTVETLGAWPAPARGAPGDGTLAGPGQEPGGRTEPSAALRSALAARHTARVDGALVIPIETTMEPGLVLVARGLQEENRLVFGEEQGTADTVAGLVAGMADRAALVASLRSEVRSDALTGLANRRALDEALETEIKRHRRSGAPLSVVMIDLDEFKAFNDRYGHQVGDALLRAMAQQMAVRKRAGDIVARYGGEEFCLVLPETTARGAVAAVDLIRASPVTSPSGRTITFSAGVAEWDDAEDPEDLVRRADKALYEAKGAGRDRTCIA